MIIKTISRKSDPAPLIRYILADVKLTGLEKDKQHRQYSYVPKFLTKADLKYLQTEKDDKHLSKIFRECNKNLTVFMTRLSGKQQEATLLKPLVITKNLRSKSIEGICHEFDVNERMRLHPRSNAVQAYHSILSFSKLDRQHITREMLEDMTWKLIDLRGANSLYVATLHQDRDHYHVHLVQSGLQYLTGKSNRVSRQEFLELKVAMQEYQKDKYPMLIHSLPDHAKARAVVKEEQKNKKIERSSSEKNSLLQALETEYKMADSLEQFLTAVTEHGHTVYYRNGRLQGIKYEGDRKFRFSGLGYSKDKLETLDAKKEKEERCLVELKNIRADVSAQRTAEMETETDHIENPGTPLNDENTNSPQEVQEEDDHKDAKEEIIEE